MDAVLEHVLSKAVAQQAHPGRRRTHTAPPVLSAHALATCNFRVEHSLQRLVEELLADTEGMSPMRVAAWWEDHKASFCLLCTPRHAALPPGLWRPGEWVPRPVSLRALWQAATIQALQGDTQGCHVDVFLVETQACLSKLLARLALWGSGDDTHGVAFWRAWKRFHHVPQPPWSLLQTEALCCCAVLTLAFNGFALRDVNGGDTCL